MKMTQILTATPSKWR